MSGQCEELREAVRELIFVAGRVSIHLPLHAAEELSAAGNMATNALLADTPPAASPTEARAAIPAGVRRDLAELLHNAFYAVEPVPGGPWVNPWPLLAEVVYAAGWRPPSAAPAVDQPAMYPLGHYWSDERAEESRRASLGDQPARTDPYAGLSRCVGEAELKAQVDQPAREELRPLPVDHTPLEELEWYLRWKASHESRAHLLPADVTHLLDVFAELDQARADARDYQRVLAELVRVSEVGARGSVREWDDAMVNARAVLGRDEGGSDA